MPALLFTPFTLRGLTLANRIVASPVAQYAADAAGCATPWHMVHVGGLALSGAGLVVMEAMAVEPRGRVSPRCLGLWDDAQVAALRPVLEFCHEYGSAAIGLQLAHAGRKGSMGRPWDGQDTIAEGEGGWRTVAASAIAYPGRRPPQPLATEELPALRDAYAAAARRAFAAGFDLIELHCADGQLLHGFLSPLTNRRDDAYGGDAEARMRFPLEVVAAVRAAWPADRPMGVRIPATDGIAGGLEADDAVELARRVRALGADYVTAAAGGVSGEQRITPGPGYQVPFARRIREEAGVPSMAVGMLSDPDQAERVLQDQSADLVGIGRGMTWDPRWAWHAATALGAAAPLPPQYRWGQPVAGWPVVEQAGA